MASIAFEVDNFVQEVRENNLVRKYLKSLTVLRRLELSTLFQVQQFGLSRFSLCKFPTKTTHYLVPTNSGHDLLPYLAFSAWVLNTAQVDNNFYFDQTIFTSELMLRASIIGIYVYRNVERPKSAQGSNLFFPHKSINDLSWKEISTWICMIFDFRKIERQIIELVPQPTF